ncbi:unnamed protein product [Brassica oleracea var. botrytis]|uniref:Uncharacterized protein n=2 Tax=Brassica TaxID=3705 RepID=A0A3P6EJQ8_BRAOL|nr:hypothetical protein HID58_076075 [Brassica napus]KAH0869062.1 hypothetical protein HID58_076084 [Brassica napus]CAF1989479.1 unnamed protein product [Brassica napus]VDD37686.1 unnamed protein product [Brassica oleracea]
MRKGSCSEEVCFDLLNQLEHLLESDPLIDEVGFIHPSQFTLLDKESGSVTDGSSPNISSGISSCSLESRVMKHSQALLLLSLDFGTAWNARKLILSKQDQPLEAFTEELRLSKLVLSNCPKSEPTWSHRRWIIKMISRSFPTPQLQEIITKESELVESIGERSKMNYRAWYHRCWLVSYMTTEQVNHSLQFLMARTFEHWL